MKSARRAKVRACAVVTAGMLTGMVAGVWPGPGAWASDFSLTLLHHSDAESALISAPGQSNYGGVARFKTLVDTLRSAAGPNVLTLANGDMFLAGAQFNASQVLPATAPYYDGLGLSAIGYDAMGFGNHEFDFGPAVTRRFVTSIGPAAGFPHLSPGPGAPKYLSANLDFSGEPALSDLAASGRLAKSTVVNVGGQSVGVVAAITPLLRSISSPGGVAVSPVLPAVQAEVDALTASGVKHIVLLSHLQNISEELALIPQLRGVDVVVAGGGEELLANAGVPLVPGDTRPSLIAGSIPNQYPLMRTDAEGRPVALVSTAGQFKYVGRLSLTFDASGVLTAASGNPVRVADVSVDAANGVVADPVVNATVVDPVRAHVSVLAANRLAESQVPLEGRRVTPDPRVGIRASETNLGNLCADALRWAAGLGASEAGGSLDGTRLVALQNGGGIRNNTLIPASPPGERTITELDTFNINAFGNFVSVVKGLSSANLKAILEHSVANLSGGAGQWGHWSGIEFIYDRTKPAGERIFRARLLDGTLLVDEYAALAGAPLVDLATINFLVYGGDAYPIESLVNQLNLEVVTYPISYQEALEFYITDSRSFGGLTGLNGLIPASLYAPVGPDNYLAVQPGRRIDAVPEPAALGLLLPGVAVLLRRRRGVA
ncbi:MAG: bifunctional metallophosphatase/5'-nucleotidase [Tepidisphaerales bacterium]